MIKGAGINYRVTYVTPINMRWSSWLFNHDKK